MCGIVGVIGSSPAAPLLLDALRRLEYRGYDSAGIATLSAGVIDRRRAEGKLGNLAATLDATPLSGTTGIGHTRWATHGAPTEQNAHPHGTPRVVVVHNGIIENHAELRAELEAAGQTFSSETDTETVAQLVDLYLKQGMTPEQAAGRTFTRLHGAFALAMIFAGHAELMIGAQFGAPLAVGFGDDVVGQVDDRDHHFIPVMEALSARGSRTGQRPASTWIRNSLTRRLNWSGSSMLMV